MSTLTLPTDGATQVRDEPLLAVENLRVTFRTRRGELHAVDGVSFDVPRSSTLGIAGESGSGKSVAVRAVISFASPVINTQISGSVRFEGQEFLGDLSQSEGGGSAGVRYRDDLPGHDALPQPDNDDRCPDCRGDSAT